MISATAETAKTVGRRNSVGAGDDDDGVSRVQRTAAPLVGRTDELAELTAAYGRAAQGNATAAVIGGDAGVGKTRLLAALAESAAEQGALLLVGHCVALGEMPPPYLPFTEAFSRLADQNGPDGDQLGELVEAYPAIAHLVKGRGGGEDRVDRGELFESVLGALTRVAATRPVLLIVEDVHWADQATRDLLGFLFTRLAEARLAIVVSFRSDDLHRRHPLRPSLAQWYRLPSVVRLDLAPLGNDDVRSLVRNVQIAPVDDAVISDIVTRAEGNAFFAEELLAAAEQLGDTGQLPWQLADLLLVRLDRLSPDAALVVRAAAVAGHSVPHEMLALVADMPAARLDAALRDAIDSNVLQLTAGAHGYSFRHALLAEAVYDDLLPGERVRLHGAYAAVLQDQPDCSWAELARHALASQDLSTAYRASIDAGDEAMRVAAPQEALRHYETALRLRAQLPSVAADDPVSLIVSIVDAALAGGHAARGRRLASQGLAELPPGASHEQRAQLLYAVARAAVDSEGEVESMDAADEALRLIPPDATLFRVRLAALFSRINLIRSRDVEAERWANEAIEQADELGHPGAATEARTTLAMLHRRVQDPDEVAAYLRDVAEQAKAEGESAAEIRSRYNLGSLYLEIGQLDASEEAYLTAWRRAEELGRAWSLFGGDARARVVEVRSMRGDWDGALAAASFDGEDASGVAAARITAAALIVRVGRGDPDALAIAESLTEWWPAESLVANSCLQAMLEVHAAAGAIEVVATTLDRAVTLLGDAWQDEWFLGRVRLSALAVAAAARAARQRSAAERAALVETARGWVEAGRTSAERGVPAGRALGVEAVAWAARLEASWAHLRWVADIDPPRDEELIDAWQAATDAFGYGNVWEQTRTRVILATVLRAAGRSAEAAEQADLARAAARRMGARVVLDDLRALGTTRAPSRSEAPAGFAALTDREREVLDLLVEARTNRQIASRLYISEKTVSVHVSSILAKLGVRSRAEAAAVARTTAGLTSG